MAYLEQFNYQIFGDEHNPKLVFLHGLMGYGKNWGVCVRALQSDFHILCYDQRGHGKSMQPNNSAYRPEDYADDLRQILQDLNWTKIHLVGHSMGGRNAHNFAYRYPEFLHSLVLEDIGPEINLPSIDKIAGIIKKAAGPFASREEAKQHILSSFEDQVLAQYLYANLIEKISSNGESTVYDFQFSRHAIMQSVTLGRSTDRWHEIAELKVPTLLIRGEQSDELSQEDYEKMLALNPLIEPCLIANAKHWVHYDQSKLFIEKLRDFLQKH